MTKRLILFSLALFILFSFQIAAYATTPSVTLTTDQSSYIYPQSVVLTATIYNNTFTEVAFYNSNIPLTTWSLAANSPVSTTWTPPGPGTYTLKATALNPNNGTVVMSSPVTITVAPHVAPTVSLSTAQSTYIYPQSIELTPNISVYGTVRVVGFYNNGVGIASSSTPPYTYTWTPAPGTYNVTAMAIDSMNASTTSSPITITVVPHVAPTISLSTAQSTYIYPQSIVLTPNISVYGGTVNGVGFYSNGVGIGSSSTAPYNFTWTPAPGTYNVTAMAIDSMNATTTSSPITITVVPHVAPTVSLSTAQSTYIYPQSIVLTPNISVYGGTYVKGVGFYNNGVGIGSSSTAPYTFTWIPAPGTYNVTAVAIDSMNASTTSSPVTVTMNPHVAPTVSLSTDKSSYYVPGNNIVMTANAWAAGAIKYVVFYNGSTPLNIATTSPYTYTWNNVAVGTYSLTANVVDSSNISTMSSPVSVSVNSYVAPTVSLTTNKASYIYPQNIVMAANPWAAGSVSSVAFYNGSNLLSTVTSSPYTYTWSPPQAGNYSLTAKVVDNKGTSTTSSPVAVTVAPHVPPTIRLAANSTSYVLPNIPVLTAYPSVSAGIISSVAFYNGSNLLSTVTSSPFTYTWNGATAGTYSLTAKTTDSTGASATSSAVAVTINPHVPPTVSLITDNTTYTYPQNVILTANASVSTGTISSVAFYNGSTLLSTVTSTPYTFSWTPSKSGSYSLMAQATDSSGARSTSTPVTITVNPHVAPTISLTTDKTTYIYPQNVILTANASVGAGTISNVSFYNGTTLIKTVTSAPYTYAWVNPSAGNYNLTAKATDSTGASTTSSAVAITVNSHVPPTVSLTTDRSSYIFPQNIVMTANVLASAGTIASVSFYNGSTLLGTISRSPFIYTWPFPKVGSYSFTAKATDSTGASTTSSAVAITVSSHVPPSVSLTTDRSSYIYPQNIVMTANALVSSGTISSVSFYNGSTLLGTVSSSPFTYTWTAPKVGSYSFTATATDSTGVSKTSSAISITVSPHVPPTINLTTDKASYIYPQAVILSPAATVSAGTITSVSFYNGSALLSTVTSSPFVYTWSPSKTGTYSLTAKATDITGASVTSSVVVITVTSHVPPTVSLSTDNTTYTLPNMPTLTALASVSAGTIANVSFYNGTTLLASITSGSYTYKWKAAPGTYSITAVATDSTGASITSSTVSITVNPHVPPVVSLSTNNTNYIYPQNLVLTANASVSAGTISNVSFYNGSTLLGTVTKSPYNFTWSGAKVGTYSLTAKATDSTNTSTTSSPVKVSVSLPPPPSMSLAIPVNNSTFTAPANIIIYPNLTPNAPIASVSYYNGTKLIGTAVSTPFSYNWNSVSAGKYSLTAVATDIYGTTGTSSASAVTVTTATPAHTPPTVNITIPANNSSYTASANIPLTATALASNASISNVSFFINGINGTTLVGTVTGSPFIYNWNNVAAGNYSVIATATDSTGAVTTSPAVNIAVNSTNATPPVPAVNNFVGVISTANIYDNPGGNIIASESAGEVGTVVGGPQTSGDQYFQVHFPDSNNTGWIDQNDLIVLATTSSEMAAYALIKYASSSYNLTPAIGGLTNAQATQLSTALNNLSGKKFMVFNGQVVLMQGNTNIQVNNVNNIVNMQVSTVGSGAQNYGTALLSDLSQINVPAVCSSSDPWYFYVNCLLDNEAKTVMSNCLSSQPSNPATCDTALNLNTDSVMGAINTYLNTTYASIGGVAKNFVITIDPTGQGVEIDPASTNNLSSADNSVSVSFYNDSLNYDPNAVMTGISQIESQTTDTNTTNFYIASDYMIDEKNISDIDQMIESVGGVALSNSIVERSTIQQKSAVQKAALQIAAIQKLAIQKFVLKAMPEAKSAASMRSMDSVGAQPVDLPDEETCYDQQSGSIIPCNTIIDYVQGQRDSWLSLPAGGISTMATLMFQDVSELQSLGYTINRITYADPQFANDALGINFLKSLIQTQGQVLFLQFHGSGSSEEDNDVGSGKIFPFGCVDPYLPQYQGLTDSNGNSISPQLAAEQDLENQLKAQLYPGYLNQDPTIPGVIGFKPGYGCYAYINGLKKPTLGWGIDLNNTNIRSKALETGYPCHGSLGALKPLAGVRNYGALSVYLNPPPSKSSSQARFDLKLLVKYLEGMGPLTPASITPIFFDQGSPYSTYPPQLDSKFDSYIQNTLDNGGPTELSGVGTMNLFDCTNTVQGPSGSVTVNIPCKMEPFGSSLHLFPYVTALSLNSNVMTVSFSDLVTEPSIEVSINGKNPITSYSYASNNQYSINLIPEIEFLDQPTYSSYVSQGSASQIPMALFTIGNAYSSINGIPMVGNPLAALTQKGTNDTPYFLYDQYFWDYSGRNQLGGQDVNIFKANIPYRLHPYVDSISSSGNQMTINFSKPVLGSGDASGYVKVDVSQCTADGAFDGGQTPEFTSNNGNSITMAFNPNLSVPAQSPTGNATITVSGIVSSANNFPLLSPSTSFSYSGGNTSTGYKDQFLQTPGSFTMSVPCSCTPSCDGAQTGDDNGCGGTCTCSCEGKTDGADDGCGNTCDCSCDAQSQTYINECGDTCTCTPSCDGVSNGGSDGCGGTCNATGLESCGQIDCADCATYNQTTLSCGSGVSCWQCLYPTPNSQGECYREIWNSGGTMVASGFFNSCQ